MADEQRNRPQQHCSTAGGVAVLGKGLAALRKGLVTGSGMSERTVDVHEGRDHPLLLRYEKARLFITKTFLRCCGSVPSRISADNGAPTDAAYNKDSASAFWALMIPSEMLPKNPVGIPNKLELSHGVLKDWHNRLQVPGCCC